MHVLKLTQIGNSVGVVLPKELLARMKVEKGDSLRVTETVNGIELTPYDERIARQIEAVERATRRYRNALKALAK